MTREVVRAAVVQMHSVGLDLDGNLRRIERAVRRAADDHAQLVVLPELCATGYVLDPRIAEVAEEIPGRTCELLSELTAELELTIVTAIAARNADGVLQDTAVIVTPAGIAGTGAKHFLWGEESQIFTAAPESRPAIADTPAGRVGVAICYEAGFPEVPRRLALEGADIIAVPSAFGQARLHAWKLMTRARALEDSCFLLAANTIGESRGLRFGGHSTVVDPHGRRLACLADGEGVLTTDLNLDALEEARQDIPYLRDLRDRRPASSR